MYNTEKNKDMIPKIIHCCWFGTKELSEEDKMCIESWKKILPDYEIKLWNEQTFDVNCCSYVAQAYERKKYAFVSDYARVWALYNYGGIYFDTDVEVLKPIDDFLIHNVVLGFENRTKVGTAVIGSIKGHSLMDEMLKEYQRRDFLDSRGYEDMMTNVIMLNKLLTKKGLVDKHSKQIIDDMFIFDRDVFFPKKISDKVFNVTEYSYTIHHMAGSWLTERQKRRGTNAIWINYFRPTLTYINKTLCYLIGETKAKQIEIIVRNLLK